MSDDLPDENKEDKESAERGYSSYNYDTDEAFSRFLQGEEGAEEEFFELLERDIEKRLEES